MHYRDKHWMQRCLDLAKIAEGNVSPNPLVGAVITAEDRVLGEGFHEAPGQPHAEVNALQAVSPTDRPLLKEASLYVNLEPCHHQGRTPPCTRAIAQSGIRRVVVAGLDPNPLVQGKGIQYLKSIGVEVTVGVLNEEAEKLNAPFLTYHRKKRPYIILKWAESDDFYIGQSNRQVNISNLPTHTLNHLWRTQVDAILIGTQTAVVDNPSLTARHIPGPTPRRLVLDRRGRIPTTHEIFTDPLPLTLLTENKDNIPPLPAHKEVVEIPFTPSVLSPLIEWSYANNIQSLLVEGGRKLLQSFINAALWDEARIVHNDALRLHKGIRCPKLKGTRYKRWAMGEEKVTFVSPRLQ